MLIRTLVLAVVLTGVAAQAEALGYGDVAGNWCNSRYRITISRSRITMFPHDGRETRFLVVTGFKSGAKSVTINVRGPKPATPWVLTVLGPNEIRLGNDEVSRTCQ